MPSPAEDPSDERIREEIHQRLTQHTDFDASGIDVRVEDGTVVLTGTVEDHEAKRLAEYVAEGVLGERKFENRLKVRHGFWSTIIGERAVERELPPAVDGDMDQASKEAGRASSAQNAARLDSDAR
jgi:BON domain